jgi:predicted ester cyclase
MHELYMEVRKRTRLQTFPDFSTEVVTLVGGEKGTVVSRQVYRGTHRGNFFEVPAAGRRVEYAGVGFFEFEGGYIRKVWVLGDLLGPNRRLGWALRSSGSGA